MISQTATLDVETSGDFKRHEFKIKATAKAFKALSADIYKNKIRAVVREYSTNAYDSHVFNGNPHEPFDVKLPNLLDPNFVIRDYGIGLSYKEIAEIYTTYFESTKDTSNDYNGTFGIGAKVGFAYTDKFDLHSYKDGVKTSYSLFINSMGVPECAKLVSVKTSERNGIEIVIPVQRQDFENFRREAEMIYAFFQVLPNVTGNSNYKKPQRTKAAVMEEKGEWEVYNTMNGIDLFNESRLIAQMGNVAYPVRLNNLNISTYSHWLFSGNAYVIVHVDIGDVDIVLSREDLDYVPHTINTLKNKIDKIEKSYQKKLETELDQYGCYWDACVKYFSQPLRLKNVSYKKKEIKNYIPNPLCDDNQSRDAQDVLEMPSGYAKPKTYHCSQIHCSAHSKFYLDDLGGKGSHTRINIDLNKNSDRAYILKTNDPKKLKKFKDEVGITEKHIIKVSDLPEPPKQTRSGNYQKVGGYRLLTTPNTSLTYNWERLDQIPSGSLVLRFENMYLHDEKGKVRRPEYVQRLLSLTPKSFKVDPQQVYALSEKKFTKATQSGFKLFWDEYFGALDKELKSHRSDYELLLDYDYITGYNNGSYGGKRYPQIDDLIDNLAALCPLVKSKFLLNFKGLIDNVHHLQKSNDARNIIAIVNETQRTTLTASTTLRTAVDAIYQKAPLLRQLSWYDDTHSYHRKKTPQMVQYVAEYLNAVL